MAACKVFQLIFLANALLVCSSFAMEDIEDLIPVRSPVSRIRTKFESRAGRIPRRRGFPGKEGTLEEGFVSRQNEELKPLYHSQLQFGQSQDSGRLREGSEYQEETFTESSRVKFLRPGKFPLRPKESLRSVQEEPQTNRHKKDESLVQEEDKFVGKEWHEPGLLDVVEGESPSATGFPRQLETGFKQPQQGQDLRSNLPQAPHSLGTPAVQAPSILSRFGGVVDARRTTTTTPRPDYWSAERAKYSFSTDQLDSISDLSHSRTETRSGGTVRGSFSYSDGYVLRTVQYIADKDGYRVLGEENTPLSADGPVVDPSGRASVQADVDGHGYNYIVRGEDVYRPRYRTAQPQKDYNN